jgi:hypothetical protein
MKAFFLLLLLTFNASAAEVTLGLEREVRPPTPSPTFGQQIDPQVAWNGRSYVAVWIDLTGGALRATRLNAEGRPLKPMGQLVVSSGVMSARIAAAENGYIVVWKADQGLFSIRLNDFGTPVGEARALASSAATPLALAWNGSTYLLVSRADGVHPQPVTIWILDGEGKPIVTKVDAPVGPPLAVHAVGRTYVYVDAPCPANCARIITVAENGELTARTIDNLPDSYERAAFSDDRILLVSANSAANSYVLVDYQGNVVAADTINAKSPLVDAGWDGRRFIVFLVDREARILSGARITPAGNVIDPLPFNISHTFAYTGSGHNLVSIAGGASIMAIWSDTFFSGQADVVARSVAAFDDLASAPDTRTLLSDQSLNFILPPQRDVQLASANGRLLAIWSEGTNLRGSLDGQAIDIDIGTTVTFPVAAAGNECFLVAWFQGSNYVARRIGFDGRLLDAQPFAIANDRTGAPGVREWSLAHDGTNFVFVWAYGGIRAVRIAESGAVLDATKRTIITFGDRDIYETPAVALTGAGLFAGWFEISPPSITLFGARLKKDATSDGSPRTLQLSGSAVSRLAVASDGDRVTYAWGEEKCLLVAQFTAGGELLTAPRAIDCGTPHSVQIAWSGSEYVVVWSAGNVRAMRVDRQGNPMDAAPFDVSPPAKPAIDPAVTATPAGVTIAYSRPDETANVSRIFARELARLGTGPSRRRAIER